MLLLAIVRSPGRVAISIGTVPAESSAGCDGPGSATVRGTTRPRRVAGSLVDAAAGWGVRLPVFEGQIDQGLHDVGDLEVLGGEDPGHPGIEQRPLVGGRDDAPDHNRRVNPGLAQ